MGYTPPEPTRTAVLFETFHNGSYKNAWVRSRQPEYNGIPKVKAYSAATPTDKGLFLGEGMRRYGVARPLVARNASAPLIVQYEVKFTEPHECGGAYFKFLAGEEGAGEATREELEHLGPDTPYSFLFGPDHCGNKNEVQFVVHRHNPKLNRTEELRMTDPPGAMLDHYTHLYTLVVRPALGTFEIKIDRMLVREGNFSNPDDFSPPFNPPEEVDDPSDTAPAGWDDRALIPDPASPRPADWDESQPELIPDPAATLPPKWRQDLPALVPDPTSRRPADWSDDEDGEWEPAMVANRLCADLPGCGPWEPPMVRNPRFVGPWQAPLIPNPDFRGVWRPRKTPNPAHFRVERPGLLPFNAVALEVWTVSAGVAIDNLYVGHGLEDHDRLAQITWKLRAEAEGWTPSHSRMITRASYASWREFFEEFYREQRNLFLLMTTSTAALIFYGIYTVISGKSRGGTPVGAGMSAELAAEIAGWSDEEIANIVRSDKAVNAAARTADPDALLAAFKAYRLKKKVD